MDEDLKSVPFVVLGNKIDAHGAVSEEELRAQLGLHQTTGKVRSLVGSGGDCVYVCAYDRRRYRVRFRSRTSGPWRCSCAPSCAGRAMAKVRASFSTEKHAKDTKHRSHTQVSAGFHNTCNKIVNRTLFSQSTRP